MDNELILFDRINVIKDTIKKYGEENFYVSFSGGKDSTVLSHLIDEALPNNQIPRLFMNTGMEFKMIVQYVKQLAKSDNRIIIMNSNIHIPTMLKEYGYPFKSKEHSHRLSIYGNSGVTNYIQEYLDGVKKDGTKSRYKCPQKLKYQFETTGEVKFSEQCCNKLKKDTALKFEAKYKKNVAIIGVRQAEGGARSVRGGCVVFDSKTNELKKFKPLNPVTDDWLEWYIQAKRIKLCELYYPPYSFKRTGCKGYPFTLNLQEQLDKMEDLLPAEKKQCEYLWKPVYAEYRRIGYRLRKSGVPRTKQIDMFEFLDDE